jgi:ABC-2 type transport system ATP-binding protein
MLLEVENVVKEYKGKVRANDGITLSLDEGEVFGLLGPNGAGKSTLVNQIIGLTVPTSGSIRIAGIDIVKNPDFARQACSFQSQTQVPIAGLTACQAIELVGMIRGGKKEEVKKRARHLIENMEIQPWANKMGAAFSGGIRRIVAFCMAAVTPGRIVILDEPTNDIDPIRRKLLWNNITTLARDGSAVLLVTHNVLEAERAVDRLAIIDKGRVLCCGSVAEIKGKNGTHMRLELEIEPGAVLGTVPAFVEVVLSSGHRTVAKVANTCIAQAADWAYSLKNQHIISEFSLGPTTLEDAYLKTVGRLDVAEAKTGV